MAIKAAAITNWLPGATVATGTFTIPSAALTPTMAAASGNLTDDIRLLLLGLLDQVYTKYTADVADDGAVNSVFKVTRAVLADKVQFVVTINASGQVSVLPTYA